MSRTIDIVIQATIGDDTDPNAVVEKVYDLLASDPDDLIPEIETVDGWDCRILA